MDVMGHGMPRSWDSGLEDISGTWHYVVNSPHQLILSCNAKQAEFVVQDII
jgi:hypothetical protein